MFDPEFLLSLGILMIALNTGLSESPLFKKYPLISKILQLIACLCMFFSRIQIR